MDGHAFDARAKLDKVFFQVLIEYEDCTETSDMPRDSRSQESLPIGDFMEADEIARHTSKQIQSMFPGTTLVELPLDQAADGYHLLVVSEGGKKVAKVGVVAEDYSRATIH